MKGAGAVLIVVLLVVGAIIVAEAAYIVDETEQVIITQFGDPVGDPVREPGLHWKKPFVQKVNRFDRRLLAWDGFPNQIPSKDKKYIHVDTFARWRIKEPLQFLKAVRDETTAQARLDDIIDGATRDAITGYTLIELVRDTNRPLLIDTEASLREAAAGEGGGTPGAAEATPEGAAPGSPLPGTGESFAAPIRHGRTKIMGETSQEAGTYMANYGVELADVRIKRVNYVEEVRRKVYDRMSSERKQIAERYRSEGREIEADWTGRIEKERDEIESEAYRQAKETKAKADAEAARIYADAYNKDPEFYAFWKALQVYRESLGTNTILVVGNRSEVFRYLREAGALPAIAAPESGGR